MRAARWNGIVLAVVAIWGSAGTAHAAPPSATTGPATPSSHTAELTASIDPHGADATVHFDLGTSTAYGRTVSAPAIAGSDGTATATGLAVGLTPNTTYHYRVVAATTGGTATGADATFTTLATVPLISRFKVTPGVFAVAKDPTPTTGTATARWRKLGIHKRGTTFSLTVDQPSTITVLIEQRVIGRLVGRTCRPLSRALRHRPRCAHYVSRGTLTRTGHAGVNSIAFSGRMGSRALKPSRYYARIHAATSAGQSLTSTRKFEIAAH